MIIHPDGSPLLHHFIRPEHLISLFEKRAFHLTRQDLQASDPNDGILPADCFDNPHIGPFERAHRIDKDFAISQARAIASLRPRTYIISWTKEPSEELRRQYGENGRRCELRASLNALAAMIGYVRSVPPDQSLVELPGVLACAQLKSTRYTDGRNPISVFPSAFATTHKDADKFSIDAEIRIEAIAEADNFEPAQMPPLILWNIHRFADLSVTLASRIAVQERERISALCTELSIPVYS
jgi:hypothetical protein